VTDGNGIKGSWTRERKEAHVSGPSGIIALLILVLAGFAMGTAYLDRARALEHQRIVLELRTTNYLLNRGLPPAERITLPPPEWLDEWLQRQREHAGGPR